MIFPKKKAKQDCIPLRGIKQSCKLYCVTGVVSNTKFLISSLNFVLLLRYTYTILKRHFLVKTHLFRHKIKKEIQGPQI